jgi:hypothetical protein
VRILSSDLRSEIIFALTEIYAKVIRTEMTEQDSREALQEMGITNPSKALVENWLRVQQYEEAASPPLALKEMIEDMQGCISLTISLTEGKKP